MADGDPKVEQFMAVTGADAATAKSMLEAAKGDVDAALALHFDVGPDDEEEASAVPAAPAEPAAPPALPAEKPGDLVSGILKNARNDTDKEDDKFAGLSSGRALGSTSSEEEPAAPPPPADPMEAAMLDRTNAKKIRARTARPSKN